MIRSTTTLNADGARAYFIEPRVFGPLMWRHLHIAACRYAAMPTQTQQHEMHALIVGLPAYIPCTMCQQRLRAYLQQRRDTLRAAVASRDNLFAFFVDMHNHVNQHLGKATMSLARAKQLYNF